MGDSCGLSFKFGLDKVTSYLSFEIRFLLMLSL